MLACAKISFTTVAKNLNSRKQTVNSALSLHWAALLLKKTDAIFG